MNRRAFPKPDHLSPAGQRIERQKWREYLADLKRLAELAADGGVLSRDDLFVLQRHVFRGAGSGGFPLPGAAFRAMAKALDALAHTFVSGGPPEPRLAAALAAVAGQLDGGLHDAAQTAADAWRGQFPDA